MRQGNNLSYQAQKISGCPPPLMFIVLNEVDQKIDRWIRDIAWEVGFENDRVITTVLLDKEQFEHGPMAESTIVDNIQALVTYRLEQAKEPI